MTQDYMTAYQVSLTMPNAAFTELMAAVLERGALFRFAAAGFSMLPFIHNGDVITLAPAPGRVRFGDVVAFVNPRTGKLTVHRVVGKVREAYLIKGDNSPEEDGVVEPRHIIGRVRRVERAGRYICLGLGIERIFIAFLSQRGWLFPVLVPFGRIVRPFVKRFVK